MAVLESHNGYYLWKYLPSTPAAIIFLVLFVATTGLHLWRMIKTKTWFCTVFVIGGFFEVIGYIGRAIAHNQTSKLMPFILQNFFILLGPALFARPHHPLRDVLSFMIQGGAAGLMVTGNNVSLGNNIVIPGLAIQVISFGLFIVTAIIFQVRISKFPTRESVLEEDMPWKQNLYALYAMSVLVLIRSVFRVVEYSLGYDGYALEHEWTLYIFDSVPMFFVTIVFLWRYPSILRVLPKDEEAGSAELAQVQTVHEGK